MKQRPNIIPNHMPDYISPALERGQSTDAALIDQPTDQQQDDLNRDFGRM